MLLANNARYTVDGAVRGPLGHGGQLSRLLVTTGDHHHLDHLDHLDHGYDENDDKDDNDWNDNDSGNCFNSFSMTGVLKSSLSLMKFRL